RRFVEQTQKANRPPGEGERFWHTNEARRKTQADDVSAAAAAVTALERGGVPVRIELLLRERDAIAYRGQRALSRAGLEAGGDGGAAARVGGGDLALERAGERRARDRRRRGREALAQAALQVAARDGHRTRRFARDFDGDFVLDAIEAGGDHRDLDHVRHVLVDRGAEDD